MKVLASILTVAPTETTIQLIKNIKNLEPNIHILLHISWSENYDETVRKIKNSCSNSKEWLFFNPKQIPTTRCYITQALLANMDYAYSNLDFDYYLVLPFNCLMVKSGLLSYIKEQQADIYCQFIRKTAKNVPLYTRLYNKITTGSGKSRFTSSRWFRKSIYARTVLKPFMVDKYLYECNHEGLCIKKEVLKYFIPLQEQKAFKGLTNPKKHDIRIKINKIFRNYFIYPHISEEVVFATIIKYLIHHNKYTLKPVQFCYLNINQQDKPNYSTIKNRINSKPEKFFYKWVSTDPNDINRQAILKQFNVEKNHQHLSLTKTPHILEELHKK